MESIASFSVVYRRGHEKYSLFFFLIIRVGMESIASFSVDCRRGNGSEKV